MNMTLNPDTKVIQRLAVSSIKPSPFQTRRVFRNLDELADNILRLDLIQPIVVRPDSSIDADEDGFELIIGERRLRSVRDILEQTTINAIVKDVDDKQAFEMCNAENKKRDDLIWVEDFQSIVNYKQHFNFTDEQAATGLNLSNREAVSLAVRVLKKLDTRVLDYICDADNHHHIRPHHAKELLSLQSEQQLTLAKIIVKKELSVRNLRLQIERLKHRGNQTTSTQIEVDPIVGQAKSFLNAQFAGNIKFNPDTGKGQVLIPFASENALKDIVQLLGITKNG